MTIQELNTALDELVAEIAQLEERKAKLARREADRVKTDYRRDAWWSATYANMVRMAREETDTLLAQAFLRKAEQLEILLEAKADVLTAA